MNQAVKKMAKIVDQIVHESEAQRQFVRVQLPARVELKGKTYVVKDVSSGGLGIRDIAGDFVRGQILKLVLILPFADFALDITLEAQVQSYDDEQCAMGVRFSSLTASQVSLLNHVLKAFIAGDVVAAGDLLSVVSRENFVKLRQQKDGTKTQEEKPGLLRQAVPLLLIAALGAGALSIIGKNVYNNMFVLSSNNGVVNADVVTVRAQGEGFFRSAMDQTVFNTSPGTVMAHIASRTTSAEGEAIAHDVRIESPCDCYVIHHVAQDGEYVTPGAPLFQLAPADTQPWVSVSLPSADAHRLKINNPVTLHIAGSDIEATGRVINIELDKTGLTASGGTQAMANIKIMPDQRLPVDFTGRPVQANFELY